MMDILETATLASCGFLVKKYVFLEQDMETNKQRIFYGISFFLIVSAFFAFGKDAASIWGTGIFGNQRVVCYG